VQEEKLVVNGKRAIHSQHQPPVLNDLVEFDGAQLDRKKQSYSYQQSNQTVHSSIVNFNLI
jgi:hypothetical protein